ncbi:MAG TPA: hypothetical protein VGQ00_04445 [Candidatus Norongarragalinales archaeon]|jgi:hypothetical protein|nr:hypothetical protein [Candidatus Norongarragalinales archaeon]
MGVFGSTGVAVNALRSFGYGFAIALVAVLAVQAAGLAPGVFSFDFSSGILGVDGAKDGVVAFVMLPVVTGLSAALVDVLGTLNISRRMMQTAVGTNRRRHWLLGFYALKGLSFGFFVFFMLLLSGFFLQSGVSFNMPYVLELHASPATGLVNLQTRPFFIGWLALGGIVYGWYRLKKQAQYPDETALSEYLY